MQAVNLGTILCDRSRLLHNKNAVGKNEQQMKLLPTITTLWVFSLIKTAKVTEFRSPFLISFIALKATVTKAFCVLAMTLKT